MSDDEVESFRKLVSESGVGEHLSGALLDLHEHLLTDGQWAEEPALPVLCADIAARQARQLRAELAVAKEFISLHERSCWEYQAALSARQALAWVQFNDGPVFHGWHPVLADDLVFLIARLIRRTSKYELCRECADLRDAGCELLPRHQPLAAFWRSGPIVPAACVHRFRGHAGRARRMHQSHAILANWAGRHRDASD
jgi:hypothetical protein